MSEPRHTKFYRSIDDKKWMGVCAGIADYTGTDVNIVRVIAIVLTLVSGPWTFAAYFLTGWITPYKPRELREETPEQAKFWQGVRSKPQETVRRVRSKFRDIDRRLADMESYLTSSNTRLAREIDQLR